MGLDALNRRYPTNLNMKERRRRYRFAVLVQASLWPKSGQSQNVDIIDLSVDGAGIEPSKPVEVGSTGVLRIDSLQGSLRLPYSVVRIATVNNLKRAGLAFFLMDPVRLQLAALLDAIAK